MHADLTDIAAIMIVIGVMGLFGLGVISSKLEAIRYKLQDIETQIQNEVDIN